MESSLSPRSFNRGDASNVTSQFAALRFNPRPGHVTGATRVGKDFIPDVRVSIRAPVT